MAYPAQFRKKLLSIMAKEGLTIEEGAKRFAVGKREYFTLKKQSRPDIQT